MAEISEILKRQTRRMELAKLLDETRKNDPDFYAELAESFGSNGAEKRRGKNKNAAIDDGAFNKVKAVLEAAKNEWTETTELRDATKLSKSQLGYVLTKTHADRFDRRNHPEHGRKLQWKLKTA